MFKLTANKEDVIKFSIFSVAMFLMVAVLVNNISVFAATGKFAGLNPFEVFLDLDTLLLTIIVTIVVLLSIIFGTSSQFFEKEKGFGFSFAKKDKGGYSRWATEKEFKTELKHIYANDKTTQVAGIPLINNGRDIWVDNGEFHNLIIGSTGSGKTEMLVQPMVKILAKKGESMIITDPKGEIYENNANELKEKGYNVVLLNFRDPQKGNSWNPLTLPYELYRSGNKDKANELLDDLAMNILYDEKAQNQDPFWEKTSADYFTGLALGLFEDAKEEEINLNSINLMTTVGEDKLMASTYIKEYFTSKDPASPAYVNASSTIMAPSDTKNSILSVFKQKIKLFASRENLSEMLCQSDFDMKDIGRKKTAVFVVIQDEKKTYHSLVTIFVKQCYESLIDVAQENGGKLEYRTNFILDEFANMPPLKDVTTMVTAARSRKIRFSFIIQNFAQLSQVYGQENGDTIRGNCGNIIYLISSEMKALEEISKMCGEVKSKEKDKTASTPLVTVSDLQRLKMWTIIVLRTRCMPFKTVLKPNWAMEKENSWGKKYEKADYPIRKENHVKLFDLKAFVNKMREEKMANGATDAGFGGGMFGGGMFSNPNLFNPNANMAATNPFMKSQPQEAKPAPEFDSDDIVKKIDAKIAELEEEERKEKEIDALKEELEEQIEKTAPTAVDNVQAKVVNKPISVPSLIIDDQEKTAEPKIETETKLDNSTFDEKIYTEPLEIEKETIEETKPDYSAEYAKYNEELSKNEQIEFLEETQQNGNKNISDDQFFDDFFDDGE